MNSSIYSPAYSPYMSIGRTPPTKRALYRNQEDSANSTIYHEYPTNKPFTNSDYKPSKPASPFPESNRQAVISALKNLQDKIRKLEIERTSAEDNLKSLASETNKYKSILHQEKNQKQASQTMVSKHTQELESQLTSAEGRCNLLEKQLDYMRKMVHTAEKERQDAISQQSLLEKQREVSGPDFSTHMEKINDLEREHLKLTATQTLAQNKIKELEDKLREERLLRQLEENRPAEVCNITKISISTIREPEAPLIMSRPIMKSKKNVKKKKKVIAKKSRPSTSDPKKHYRLNLAEIPFVAGKSSTPSHSVGANVQRVLSMLKAHNTDLCSSVNGQAPTSQENGSSKSSGYSSPTLDSDLADLLLQLQDEFGQMSFDHRELSNQMNEAYTQTERDDLERELEFLVSRMEAKSQQISKIRQHQMKVILSHTHLVITFHQNCTFQL
ncbi:hypothetical protein ScPMuIL_012531 [Solemya velum]